MLSSMGINVNVHYCGNQIKGISLWGEAANCYEMIDAKAKSCCSSKRATSLQLICQSDNNPSTDTNINKRTCHKDCCHNQQISISTDYQIINSSITEPIIHSLSSIFVGTTIDDALSSANAYLFIPNYPSISLLLLCKKRPAFTQCFLC